MYIYFKKNTCLKKKKTIKNCFFSNQVPYDRMESPKFRQHFPQVRTTSSPKFGTLDGFRTLAVTDRSLSSD